MTKIFGSFVVCLVLFSCLGTVVSASGFFEELQNMMGFVIGGDGYPDTQAMCASPHTLEVYDSCKYVSAAGREYYIKYISWSNDNKPVIEVNGVTYVKSVGGFITLEYTDPQSEQLIVVGMSNDEHPKLTISFSGANEAAGEYSQFSSNTIIVYGAYTPPQDYTYCLGELKTRWPNHVIKQDSDVTAADKETKNLILLSGPASNKLVGDLASAGKTLTVAEWMENYQGRYITHIVKDAYASGKDALIIAGWNVEQSKNACNHFLGNKPPTVIDKNEKCTDSDGGRNYYVKGTTEGWNDDYTETGLAIDTCNEGKSLSEYYCDIGVLSYVDYNCPNGCEDGACVKISDNPCDLPATALDTKSECETAGCDWLPRTHGCGNTGAWSIDNCGYELHDYECSIKASWSRKWDGAVSECYNCDCSWCCCPAFDNDHTAEKCIIGRYNCEKDSSGKYTGWSQKCYDESKGWVNVVYCGNGCNKDTGQCNSKEEDIGTCGDGVCEDKEERICPQDCMQVYPSGSNVEYCTASGGKRYPASGEGAATWFLWNGCSRYKEYEVVPTKELRFLITGDSCSSCVCYSPNFKIYEYDDSIGEWTMTKQYSPKGYRGYRDNLYYVPQSSKIKVEASRCFYLRIYYRYKQDFPNICGDGICASGESIESCPKDCANFRCIGEGESIPAISNRFQCCGSLKLIKPKSGSVIGSSGICTARCGNGVCDSDVETDYNCPEDCKITASCTDSDGGKNYHVKGICKSADGSFNEDSCVGDMLNEFYCLKGHCATDYKYYTCPNGCENGACRKACAEGATGFPMTGAVTVDGNEYSVHSLSGDLQIALINNLGIDVIVETIQCDNNAPVRVSERDGSLSAGQSRTMAASECVRGPDSEGTCYSIPVVITYRVPEGIKLKSAGRLNGMFIRDHDCPEIHCSLYCKNGFEVDAHSCSICRCREDADPVEPKPSECNGCLMESGCIVLGTRLKHEGKPSYCSLAHKMEVQKSEEIRCQNNYECQSNFCSDDKCVDINRKVERNKDIIEKIMDFLGKLFSI